MKKTFAAGLGVCAIALAFAAKDPVIMTVNGVDVPLSEFEYLYNKNTQQQINPQTLDEYVEMFKLYKMKVEEAKAEGLDTLPEFLKEMAQYRNELAAPYLADSLYINNLVNEAYNRSKLEAEAYHIMLFKTRDGAQNAVLRHRADSLLDVLKKGGDFAELAVKYSQDNGSNSKGGRMGWITVNSYPYAFEEVAFSLPEGQISEVVESPVGYHILKGGRKRNARGKVHAAHILKLTQGKDEAGKLKARHEIDSLYNIVSKNPNTFGLVAQMNSEDPGSARNNGQLPWFGAGEMVEAFDSVAFSLSDGQISEPVETQFGYHIIQRLESKDIPSLQELKPVILSRLKSPQDPRFKMIRDRQNINLSKKHKGKINEKTLAAMRKDLSRAGIDSLYLANWTTMPNANMPIASVKGKNIPAKEFISTISNVRETDPAEATKLLDDRLASFFNSRLVQAEEAALDTEQPEYHNLLKEYVDGSLLYEVSVRNVWDKAAHDEKGLEDFFKKHKDEYKWTEPHVKGFLVQATNDSIAELVKQRASQLSPDVLVTEIRKEFAPNVAIDRVLLAKGSNSVVDYLVFDGPQVAPSNNKFKVSFMIDSRIIDQPEVVDDVKGLVTGDYQNYCQEKWENELKKKYPVTVNEKVLQNLRK